jgi:hypothetical protein
MTRGRAATKLPTATNARMIRNGVTVRFELAPVTAPNISDDMAVFSFIFDITIIKNIVKKDVYPI